MNEEHNIQEFDNIFRQQLGNTSAPVPPGVWETVSSSVATTATGSAVIAIKTALWIKMAIVLAGISATAIVTYTLLNQESSVNIQPSETKNTIIEIPELKPSEQVVIMQNDSVYVSRTSKKANDLISSPHYDFVENKFDVEEKSIDSNTPVTFNLNDEILSEYVTVMNENVIPKIDSSDLLKNIEEPYVPEVESAFMQVDSSYLFIPNVVTPNNDGLNDGYLIDIKGEESVHIIIYTIKMVKVFETRNKAFAWDCKLPNGESAAEGTYVVRVIYKFRNKEVKTSETKLQLIK